VGMARCRRQSLHLEDATRTSSEELESEKQMKQFKRLPSEVLDSSLSRKVNTLRTSRRILTQIFGEPDAVNSLDNKVTTEWVIEIDGKTLATLYDYKRYELGAPGLDETYDWHVGGFNDEAYDELLAVVLEQFNELVKKIADEDE